MDGALVSSNLVGNYDRYVTWIGQQSIAANSTWADLNAANYRNLVITVTRDSLLDVSASVTLLNSRSGRAAFSIVVDGVS